MTKEQVIKELKKAGSESTKKILVKHGAQEPFFGVKVADLKKIVKKIKGEQALALELFDTGNSDAMYLAGLVADGSQMTKAQLNKWAKGAYWYMIAEYPVAWVASENEKGWEIALEWIESKKELVAAAGWSTLGSVVATKEDDELDLKKIKSLLKRIKKDLHGSQNRVRYSMNGFLIAVAIYVAPLTDEAVAIGESIGKVDVDMGGTACKVPFVTDYVEKVRKRGAMGKKRKTAKC